MKDLCALAALVGGMVALAAHLDLAGRCLSVAAGFEPLILDVLISLPFALAIAAALFVFRRWSELRREIDERVRVQGELQQQAFSDPLTGLANRALFRNRLEHAFARRQRTGEGIHVLFLDLDGFKRLNDSLGHAAGDELLAEVSRRLRTCVRAADTVARMGGDEFAILLGTSRSREDGEVMARRVSDVLEAPFPLGGKTVSITASIGVTSTAHGADAEELLRNADLAMYGAKQRGKDCWVVYERQMYAALLDRLAREEELRRAVVEGPERHFVIHYQPIVELTSGRLRGFEALLRWSHPEQGLVAPAEFIPLAEDTGLIVPLGAWVLEEACRQLAEWEADGEAAEQLTISVNAAVAQLSHPEFVDHVIDAVEGARISPSRLVLEITETLAVDATEAQLAGLLRLRDAGVRFAIDDFGTGYSRFGYVQKLPIDLIKIDRSFLAEITSGEADSAVTGSIIALAQALRLDIVPEGVETEDQAEWLRRQGCTSAQGFRFGRPMVAADIAALLKSREITPESIAPLMARTPKRDASGRELPTSP